MARQPNRRKTFKNLDIFGEPVNLRLDNKGSKHRTLVGTCVTILYFVICLVVIVLCMANDIPITLTSYPVLTPPLSQNSFKESTGVFMYIKDTSTNSFVNLDDNSIKKIINI